MSSRGDQQLFSVKCQCKNSKEFGESVSGERLRGRRKKKRNHPRKNIHDRENEMIEDKANIYIIRKIRKRST